MNTLVISDSLAQWHHLHWPSPTPSCVNIAADARAPSQIYINHSAADKGSIHPDKGCAVKIYCLLVHLVWCQGRLLPITDQVVEADTHWLLSVTIYKVLNKSDVLNQLLSFSVYIYVLGNFVYCYGFAISSYIYGCGFIYFTQRRIEGTKGETEPLVCVVNNNAVQLFFHSIIHSPVIFVKLVFLRALTQSWPHTSDTTTPLDDRHTIQHV